MIYYFFVLLILVGVVIAILMAKLPSKQAANLLRWVLGVGGLLVGGLLTIRGLAVAGIPMIGAALGSLKIGPWNCIYASPELYICVPGIAFRVPGIAYLRISYISCY